MQDFRCGDRRNVPDVHAIRFSARKVHQKRGGDSSPSVVRRAKSITSHRAALGAGLDGAGLPSVTRVEFSRAIQQAGTMPHFVLNAD